MGLNDDGRNPSVLNGFPSALSFVFVVAAFALIGVAELGTMDKQYAAARQGKSFTERTNAVAALDDAQ